jgi:hypothetical protein
MDAHRWILCGRCGRACGIAISSLDSIAGLEVVEVYRSETHEAICGSPLGRPGIQSFASAKPRGMFDARGYGDNLELLI